MVYPKDGSIPEGVQEGLDTIVSGMMRMSPFEIAREGFQLEDLNLLDLTYIYLDCLLANGIKPGSLIDM
jgi:hypothetical protein